MLLGLAHIFAMLSILTASLIRKPMFRQWSIARLTNSPVPGLSFGSGLLLHPSRGWRHRLSSPITHHATEGTRNPERSPLSSLKDSATVLDTRITLTSQEQVLFDMLRCVIEDKQLGTTIRVAGGWVRDKLLGLEGKDDVDIAIDNMTGMEFTTYMNEWVEDLGMTAIGIGVIQQNPDKSKHLETVTARFGSIEIDFVNLRTESYTNESRVPEMEIGTPLEDALRRDLTINSLFYNIHSQEIEDFTGQGTRDLVAGIVRTPLPALVTLTDDPLRALRSIRFACRFGFSVAGELARASADSSVHSALETKVSKERVYQELDLMFTRPNAIRAALLLHRYKLLPVIFPLPADVLVRPEEITVPVSPSISAREGVGVGERGPGDASSSNNPPACIDPILPTPTPPAAAAAAADADGAILHDDSSPSSSLRGKRRNKKKENLATAFGDSVLQQQVPLLNGSYPLPTKRNRGKRVYLQQLDAEELEGLREGFHLQGMATLLAAHMIRKRIPDFCALQQSKALGVERRYSNHNGNGSGNADDDADGVLAASGSEAPSGEPLQRLAEIELSGSVWKVFVFSALLVAGEGYSCGESGQRLLSSKIVTPSDALLQGKLKGMTSKDSQLVKRILNSSTDFKHILAACCDYTRTTTTTAPVARAVSAVGCGGSSDDDNSSTTTTPAPGARAVGAVGGGGSSGDDYSRDKNITTARRSDDRFTILRGDGDNNCNQMRQGAESSIAGEGEEAAGGGRGGEGIEALQGGARLGPLNRLLLGMLIGEAGETYLLSIYLACARLLLERVAAATSSSDLRLVGPHSTAGFAVHPMHRHLHSPFYTLGTHTQDGPDHQVTASPSADAPESAGVGVDVGSVCVSSGLHSLVAALSRSVDVSLDIQDEDRIVDPQGTVGPTQDIGNGTEECQEKKHHHQHHQEQQQQRIEEELTALCMQESAEVLQGVQVLLRAIDDMSLSEAWKIKPLLTGNEIQKLFKNITPREEFGKLMEAQIQWQLCNPEGTAEELRDFLLLHFARFQ